MKLFSWAHKKLHHTHRSDKNQLSAGYRPSDIRSQHLAYNEQVAIIREKPSSDTHAEVLTIGTLGMGNLLSGKHEEEEEEEEETEEEEEAEEEDDDDDDGDDGDGDAEVVHYVSPVAEGLISSHRDSVSSNRESVSSIDIQKLQEELQRILYSKLGQTGHPPCTSSCTGSTIRSKSKSEKARKQNARREEDSYGYVHDNAGSSHVGSSERKSVRQLLPLRSFLEMPMDTLTTTGKNKGEGGSSCKLLTKRHYRLLMQSLKSRLLHYTTPTRVNIPPPLFEKLVKPTLKEPIPQHVTTMDKALCLLQRVTRRGPNGWQTWNKKENPNIDRTDACINHNDEEDSLNWAISRSYRGSERFISYISNTIAQIDKNDKTMVEYNQPKDHPCDNGLQLKEGGNLQQKLSTSSLLANESWLNTDDEYLVLEL